MKNKHLLIALLALLPMFQACEGGKFDYRHRYVGTFEVVGTIVTQDETFTVLSPATVDFAEERESIRIEIAEWGIVLDVNIDRDGTMRHKDDYGEVEGSFYSKNSFDVAVIYTHSFIDSSPISCSFHGIRK